jgi:AGCS family alanine or glycine:cation symporter
MVQANSISVLVNESFQIPMWVTGLILTVLTAVVILGGIKSIARVCEGLVPFMAITYVLGCLIILGMNLEGIPNTVSLIFNSAFTGQAAIGGFLGAGMKEAIRFGIARGLFSNESGLGSAPIVAAAAQTKNPVRQALVSSTGTFWDCYCLCNDRIVLLIREWMKGFPSCIDKVGSAIFTSLVNVLTANLFSLPFLLVLLW